jgi:hypothetical protein
MTWILARMTPILIVIICSLLAWHGLTYLKLGKARVEANRWESKAESLSAQAAVYELEKAGLKSSLEAQGKAMAAIKRESEARGAAAREARKAADRTGIEAESRIARIRRGAGDTCAEAMKTAREALGL